MSKSKIMPLVVLSSICIVVTLLLSVVNMITAPIIADAVSAQANASLVVVLPEGSDFEELDLGEYKLPDEVTNVYKELNGKGFVFQMSVTGKNSGLIIMCGIDAEGKVVGTKVIAEQETDSYDANVFPNVEGTDGQYKGMSLDSFEPYLVSGATLTSRAYGNAIKVALQAFSIVNGGSVDLRDPEELLQDNLNAALGSEGVTFVKWFAYEDLNGIDALYVAANGYVFVIGEDFIGVDNSGAIVTEGLDEATSSAVNAAYEVYSNVTLTEIELPEEIDTKKVTAAYLTSSGNYVFEMNASGYGKKGNEYVASGEYIKLMISISADGKIISTMTTYQSESKGIGDICADPSYYEQFNGKDKDGVNDVENVTGATVTTSGYKAAVAYAFETLEILKGGRGK